MEHASGDTAQADPAATAIDPVCGMSVDLAAGKPTLRHDGADYHFCCQGCCDKFAADPAHYLSGAHRRAAKAAPAGTRFTCPMHREVIEDGPGDCPFCGMALEAMGVPTGEEGPNPELVDFTRRIWVGGLLTILLLILAMGPLVGVPVRGWVGEGAAIWAAVQIL